MPSMVTSSGYGAIQGAKIAMMMKAVTMKMPTQAVTVGLWPKMRIPLPHHPLTRLPQARIDQDTQHVGDRIQNDEGTGKDQAAGLYHRQIAFGHAIDHELADARIDEDRFDHDDADDQVGEIERDDGDDRTGGIRQSVH